MTAQAPLGPAALRPWQDLGCVCGLVFLCAGELLRGPRVPCVLWGGSLQPPSKCLLSQLLPAVGGGVGGPPPSALSVWPLQNLTPFRPGFHTEGKEDEEAALLGALGGTGDGKNFGHQFLAPEGTEQSQCQYLGLVPAAESIRQPPPASSVSPVGPSGPCLALGLCPPLPTDLAWALPPNKGTCSSCALCPCLALCVGWMGECHYPFLSGNSASDSCCHFENISICHTC